MCEAADENRRVHHRRHPGRDRAFRTRPRRPPPGAGDPAEIGVAPLGPAGLAPYRCDFGPVHNFYDNALYSQAPAVHGDYVYRPHYRYTAYRKVPRTYVCGVMW